ncbi:TetR/AcrR family transcriptional regulator [Clostridium botulinum]|uniref:TetR/AcrR family transcriptional regulator n=1 Tax=Clostridium botulinum TaxID=1491 RepID=A0A6B4TQK7_CLOBO|nr:TetR/AcrR family transcriptional regulator [Clostridium botulinum]NFD83706.1 TetR/AcrR family transcriptional regulator [Clostridium botulinum]NFE07677.1 TetR/AcrR family transcriptional regulator [Clostridium botulinum]NFE34334.1 TetR/AcrR family transcriptional regulator [Clostridium botulinum]NFE48820.1 TetR/AcrR family transcriptional regulator [Clostridium botulinum]
MAQIKKDEIKKDVENAALKIFSQKGYLNTKMSHIAKTANISVGNIYIYFKNKEDLFYSVVPEKLMIFLRDFLVKSIHIFNKKQFDKLANEDDYFFSEECMNILIDYRMHFLIIFEKSKGTKYENAKEELIDSLLEVKKIYLRNNHKRYNLSVEDGIKVTRIILNNLINMVLDVLKEDMSESDRKSIFRALNVYRLYGITGLNE